jgi:hypothetical protein
LGERAFRETSSGSKQAEKEIGEASLEKRVHDSHQRPGEALHLMFKFLLISPTPALRKKIDPRNTPCIPAVIFFSALDLNKFPKNLKIELRNARIETELSNKRCFPV